MTHSPESEPQEVAIPLVPPTSANPNAPHVVQEPGWLQVAIAIHGVIATYLVCVCFLLLDIISRLLITYTSITGMENGYLFSVYAFAMCYHGIAFAIHLRFIRGLMHRQNWVLQWLVPIVKINVVVQVSFPLVVLALAYVLRIHTPDIYNAFALYGEKVVWIGLIPCLAYIILNAITIDLLKRPGVRVLCEE